MLSDTVAHSYSMQLWFHPTVLATLQQSSSNHNQLVKLLAIVKLGHSKCQMAWGILRHISRERTACPARFAPTFPFGAKVFSSLKTSTWNPGACTKSQSFYSHQWNCNVINKQINSPGHHLTKGFLMHAHVVMRKIPVFTSSWEVLMTAAIRGLKYFLYVFIL